VAGGTGFKEEITLNQAGREWIASNRPPATPLTETWFGCVFQLDWSDVPKVVKLGVQQDVETDWEADNESVELRDATDRLLAFLPIDYVYVPVSGAQGEYPQERLQKRFYKDGGNHYLLVGVRVDRLLALPAGDVIFDPTVEEQVGASTDDGHEHDRINYYDQTDMRIGAWPGAGADQDCATRFQTVAIANGASIVSAYWRITAKGSGGDPTNVVANIYLEDVDDAAAPSAIHRPSQMTGTTAFTALTLAAWVTDTQYSWDLVDEVQEVVNRGGWASGQDMMVFTQDQGTPASDIANIYPYNDTPAKAAELDITYSTGAAARRYAPIIME
jgi:hypothetical protein